MKEVYYKGVKTLMVYFIPKITSKGDRQYPQDMCYIGEPFHKIVEYKEVKKK